MNRFRKLCFAALGAAWAASANAEDSGATGVGNGIVQLPRFEVRESTAKISDFGMSVVTNFGVLFGSKIAWMRVGTVLPGSPAALAGLDSDDQIVLIDDLKVSDLDRQQMLHTFFQREPGARVRLLVREGRTKRWRLVELSTKGHRIEK